MAYGRKRYYRRRYAKKPLSNYNIATRTGAKSQSKQIYYLKKRINRIQRLTKPEIRIIQRNADKINLLSGQGNVTWTFSVTPNGTNTRIIFPPLGSIEANTYGGSTEGEALSAPSPNNFARLNGLKIYGNMQYTALSETSAPVNVRLVIVQSKTTRYEGVTAADVFTSGISGEDNFAAVFGPLQIGLARTCKVLSDKRYCLSYQRPSVNIRTSLKYLMNYYRDSNSNTASGPASSSDGVAKGVIYVFYAIYTAATTTVGTLNLMYKLAYTDA